ncbi:MULTISPECIES: hypothetical protein [unclassified Bradyrhizobium]
MTTLFPITIEVEEPKVGAVLRLLHHTEGVARFHLDFDKLKARRGAAKRNGREDERHAQPRPPQKSIIISALMAGPQSIDVLKLAIERHGHRAGNAVDTALTALRRQGIIATKHTGGRWDTPRQLGRQFSNFISALKKEGLVGEGLTMHGLRVTFAAARKRETGATDEEVAAALGDRDKRMGAHYTRHVENELKVIRAFTANMNRTGFANRAAQVCQSGEKPRKNNRLRNKGGP